MAYRKRDVTFQESLAVTAAAPSQGVEQVSQNFLLLLIVSAMVLASGWAVRSALLRQSAVTAKPIGKPIVIGTADLATAAEATLLSTPVQQDLQVTESNQNLQPTKKSGELQVTRSSEFLQSSYSDLSLQGSVGTQSAQSAWLQ